MASTLGYHNETHALDTLEISIYELYSISVHFPFLVHKV